MTETAATGTLGGQAREPRPKLGVVGSQIGLKGQKNVIFSNWAGIFSCKPALFFQPETVDEIKQLVLSARDSGHTLTTVGSGHSPSDLCMTSDWLVNLDKFRQVLHVAPHPSGLYTDVTVEAGIRIYQLNEFLAQRNLAIQNLGSISEQSIAGIISTGTHGASPFHGLVSQQIVDITIVNGLGQEVTANSETNQDLFRACLLSLGKIGIIVRATIRTVPAFRIRSTQEVIHFDTLLSQWEVLWTSSEFIRVWWFPYAKKCILWRGEKTHEPLVAPATSWYGTRLGRLFYETLLWVAVNIYPPFTPYVEKFVFNRQYGAVETLGHGATAVQDSVEGLNMDCLFSQFVNEWAAPLNNGPEILRSLEHSISTAAQQHDFYVHVPVEIRCSNTTTSNESNNEPDLAHRTPLSSGPIIGNNLRPLLDNTPKLNYVPHSDVTNSQLTLYINATMYRPFHTNSPIGKWYRIFEEILGAAGGKPHWAKNFLGDLGATATRDGEMVGLHGKIDEWFGDDLALFKKIRAQQDPHNVFLGTSQWAQRNGVV